MHVYPFSALVGSDDLALALTLCAVSPSIGGVLVRGEKGTAKSTAVRAQTALLPPVDAVSGCRFVCDPSSPDPQCPDGPHDAEASVTTTPARLVELPVGATEDRVTGSLHLGKALAGTGAEFEPGLLAQAHRGVLYVDEVNLLHDHLVDLLLDASAMGRVSVERDGVSVTHAARFVLVGTMNPEEGELRPQLLDRFGLTVEVAAPRDAQVRAEIVRRRLAFDADPDGFVARWVDEESALARRIAEARALAPHVRLGDTALVAIAEVCAAFDVDGMRADLVTAKTAAAHAAWSGRKEVGHEDIAAAARLALPHRRRRNPFDEQGMDEDLLDELLRDGGAEPDEPQDDDGPRDDGPDDDGPDDDGPDDDGPDDDGPGGGAEADGHEEDGPDGREPGHPPRGTDGGPREDSTDHAPTSVTAAGEHFRAKLLAAQRTGRGAAGRRSRARTTIGRTVGERRGDTGPVHLPATIRAAALRQTGVSESAAVRRSAPALGRRRIDASDIRRKVIEGHETNLVLLCVDASGSMAARKRMAQVKSAVLSLLLDAYRRRDTVGLVTFRDGGATLALPPTNSVDIAAARLADLPAGGRTPLAEGLDEAAGTLRRHRRRDPDLRPLLIVVTDGRATSGPDAVQRSSDAADRIAAQEIPAVVLDSESGRFRLGLARDLAERMGAEHVPVGDVRADTIAAVARRHAPGASTGTGTAPRSTRGRAA